MDLFRLPQPSSRLAGPATEPKRNGDPLPPIPEQFNPAAQVSIRATSAQASTTRHDGYMRVLFIAPLGIGVAFIAELPMLPVVAIVAAGVAFASWLDRESRPLAPTSHAEPQLQAWSSPPLLPARSYERGELDAAGEVLS